MSADTRVLAFAAGGWPLFCPIEQVDRVVEEQQVIALPFAGPGLVGLLVDDDAVVPLYDLDALGGEQPARPRQQDFALAVVLISPGGRLAVRLDRLVGLPRTFTMLAGSEGAVAELPARLQPCITGVAMVEGLLAFALSAPALAERLASGGPVAGQASI